jgi:hypothetical protein
MFGLCAALVA